MNTFNQKLEFQLSFKIDKNIAVIALKKYKSRYKKYFLLPFFSVITIRLIILVLAARFQKHSNMFFLILQIL